jgi:hypothetical protein
MVFLLGCDHYLQEYELTEPNDELRRAERESKEQFYELTKEIIRAEQIQFIGEECMPNQKTIPRVLASELGCDHAEIDMLLDERAKRGIERNYQELGEEVRDRVYAIREEHMVERIYSESSVEMRKLIVCGAEHMKGLHARRAEHGERITFRDLTKEDWVLEIYRKKEELILGPHTRL